MPSLRQLRTKLSGLLRRLDPRPWLSGRRASRAGPTLVVLKARNARWCWELTDERGRVHGRSTAEFVRQEQAIASARLARFLIADSVITDQDGREIEDA